MLRFYRNLSWLLPTYLYLVVPTVCTWPNWSTTKSRHYQDAKRKKIVTWTNVGFLKPNLEHDFVSLESRPKLNPWEVSKNSGLNTFACSAIVVRLVVGNYSGWTTIVEIIQVLLKIDHYYRAKLHNVVNNYGFRRLALNKWTTHQILVIHPKKVMSWEDTYFTQVITQLGKHTNPADLYSNEDLHRMTPDFKEKTFKYIAISTVEHVLKAYILRQKNCSICTNNATFKSFFESFLDFLITFQKSFVEDGNHIPADIGNIFFKDLTLST